MSAEPNGPVGPGANAPTASAGPATDAAVGADVAAGAAGNGPPAPSPPARSDAAATPPDQPAEEQAAAVGAAVDAENVAQINARDPRIERAFLGGKQFFDHSTHFHSVRERVQVSERSFHVIGAKELERKLSLIHI